MNIFCFIWVFVVRFEFFEICKIDRCDDAYWRSELVFVCINNNVQIISACDMCGYKLQILWHKSIAICQSWKLLTFDMQLNKNFVGASIFFLEIFIYLFNNSLLLVRQNYWYFVWNKHIHSITHALRVWTIHCEFWVWVIYAPRDLRLSKYVCLRLYAIYVVEARFWCISVDRNIFISVCVFFCCCCALCSSSFAQAKNAIKSSKTVRCVYDWLS